LPVVELASTPCTVVALASTTGVMPTLKSSMPERAMALDAPKRSRVWSLRSKFRLKLGSR
jgi:hypothetical protein